MKVIYHRVLGVISLIFLILCVVSLGVVFAYWNPLAPEVTEPSLLTLQLEGVIADGSAFVQKLRAYREDPNIKGVLIRVNSPGGIVGSSQEIYSEIRRVREEYRKPVVVAGGSLVTGGAYLAAVGADRIVVNPGTLLGSMSVRVGLTQTTDAELTTEKGPNVSDHLQKEILDPILIEMHDQFKNSVQKGRALSPDVVNKYSDGRIFTGDTAVRLGFADQIGTFEDARRLAGDLAGLGSKPRLFDPGRRYGESRSWVEADIHRFFSKNESPSDEPSAQKWSSLLQGRPLYLMPGTL